MNADEATFYRDRDYSGQTQTFKVGEVVPNGFRSFRLGGMAKVWRLNLVAGWNSWKVDCPNLSDYPDAVIRVVDRRTEGISVRLRDDTGAAEGRYSLKVVSYEVGEVTTLSGDSVFRLVGSMPYDGPPVTTAFYIRDEQTFEYLAIGAIHFVWNPATKAVDIADQANLPGNVACERYREELFDFRLTSSTR
ncbi:hypothetical protein [Nocardia kruczakiae]|uniref:hypothetical protein n=1 Tax=Nocardia kruczakiae TaxID=261477 RepID=UPI0007A5401F|nr:hypothetical protein [Nocardia kruczakiae]